MAKTCRDRNLEQTLVFPPSVQGFVPEGRLAHFVRVTTRESLDLAAVLDTYTEELGFPPYHPATDDGRAKRKLMNGIVEAGAVTDVAPAARGGL